MSKIAVIGTTSWGITLSLLMAQKGEEVWLWARTRQEAVRIKKSGPDSDIFARITFPPKLHITSDLEKAMSGVKAVFLVVPSQTMRQNIKLVAPYLTKSTIIVSAAKGIEIGTGKRMSQVIAEEINPRFKSNICVLSGPNLAREVVQNLPAATVVASEDGSKARQIQKLLTTSNLCVFTNNDVIGVELGGALKNIIALGAGIADGLGYGDNAKSAYITRGLTEISALGVALGANPLTFSGLAGLGDLVATCASPFSRNHYVGVELGKGRPLKEILDSMDSVAEGVSTTLVAYELARKMGLGMPITERLYKILYEKADPRQVALEMIGGNARHELVGRRWRLFSFFRRKKQLPGENGSR